MNAELSEDDRRRWHAFGADRSGAQTEPASGAACQWHAFSADRSGAETPSPSYKKTQKKEARDGALGASGARLAPTGAERRPNPRAGPIPVPKIAQKKKRETGIEPATPTLARWCSTAEPLAHCRLTTKRIIHYPCGYVNKNLK